MSPVPAGRLGNHDILGLLGKGGMGEVYRARDRVLGREVAIKILPARFSADSDRLRRFEQEARAASALNHPNIITIHGIGHADETSYIITELIGGQTLREKLVPGKMELPEALDVAVQVSGALAAAHAAGIVHRDIKPANIMLRPDGYVKVLDFGLAKLTDTETEVPNAEASTVLDLTDHGRAVGTVRYMAPEQARGLKVDARADIFSLGVVLYEMVAGKPPFEGRSAADLIAGILLEEPAPLSRALPDVPAELDRIVSKALTKSPDLRYQSMKDLHIDLKTLKQDLELSAKMKRLDARPTADAQKPIQGSRAPWTQKTRIWLFALLFLGLVLLSGALWFELPIFETLLHPLPQKRFVALMAWPADLQSANRPLLNSVLRTIGVRLSRAEASVKDLLVVSPSDVAGQTPPKDPADTVGALGANLVMAASLQPSGSGITLNLRVLEAQTGKELRSKRVFTTSSELNRLPESASVIAAKLLDIRFPSGRLNDQDELSSVAPGAFQLYNAAEDLVSRPNDSGLDQAIEKYQQALDIDPRFALGYARLSMAYTRRFFKSQDRASLSLAARNADLALRYNPDSAKSVLSRALVDLRSGNTQQAIDEFGQALKLDPGNPQVLLYRAIAFRDLDLRQEEENAYRSILEERPNYWPAYNELGWTLYRHANYRKAAEVFAEGSAVAPRVAILLTNLGTMHLLLEHKREAEDAFRRSLEQAPSENAYLNLGTIAFGEHDYRKALDYYLKARDLKPKNHNTWRNLADCYAMLGDPARVKESYAKAAEVLSASLSINPQRGSDWMDLALYEAKLGDHKEAETDLKNAESRGAHDLYPQFKKAQVLALLGRKDDALQLLLECIDKGLSLADVDMALDLKEVRFDPRYINHLKQKKAK